MLQHPSHHITPFPFFCISPAFSVEQCLELEKLFSLPDAAWQHRDGAFYRCSLWDVSALIPPGFQAEVLARLRQMTGLPLVERLVVTAQRMLPGQAIGIHSDRPLLGYEIARLVLQLNPHWQQEHGGVLELFASPDSEATFRIEPGYNQAFGFLLHANSHHAVTAVTQPRHSMVFNVWHAANTPELADHVQHLFTDLHFSELPPALHPVATRAEASLPEEITLRAGTAAIALKRWGYDEATLVRGYQHSAGLCPVDPADPAGSDGAGLANPVDAETRAAVLLADWVAFLYRDSFDLVRWDSLRTALAGVERFPRLLPVWPLCLPESAQGFDAGREGNDTKLILKP